MSHPYYVSWNYYSKEKKDLKGRNNFAGKSRRWLVAGCELRVAGKNLKNLLRVAGCGLRGKIKKMLTTCAH
jgi:hypothetical protein